MKKTQKKIKSIKGGEDRISDLPDHVLHHILSLLPTTKEAIRTGTLSKRWKRVWTLVPNLIFINNDHAKCSFKVFSSFVDKTLTRCGPLDLNQFKVDTDYDNKFKSKIKKWIRYAVDRNVGKLDLLLETEHLGYGYEFKLNKSFYINSSFTHLNLEGCSYNPSGAISWEKLTSLCITFGKLHEDLIQNILSGSPLLETLELSYCHGFSRIDITSKSVKNFVFSGYTNHELDYDDEEFEEDIIEINAPYISFLAIQEQFELSKLVLLSVSCLVKAYLNYNIESSTRTQEEVEEVSKGLVLSLRHVEDLTAGDLCQEVFSSLKSKGFTFPPNLGS